MPARLRDVAEKAGVSITTAAQVLREYPKSRVKQETRDKVNRIAVEIGYQPNAIARSLKTQQVKAIAIYNGHGDNSPRDPFLAEVFTGIMVACKELRYDLVVHGDLGGRTPNEIKLTLSDGKIGGLIVYAPPGDPVVACLGDGKLPAVAIADVQPNLPSLTADDVQGITMLVEYLWERGHRNMAYLMSHVPLASIVARSQTFETLVKARGGIPVILPFKGWNLDELLKDVLATPSKPTAIFCWNDWYGYAFIKACLNKGVRVPDDLAVVGFDGLLEWRLPEQRLVTIAVPWERIASDAVRILVKQIEGLAAPRLTVFPVNLVHGDTA
jgi:DNA-binding LacI/PurR family transcriptional regulator